MENVAINEVINEDENQAHDVEQTEPLNVSNKFSIVFMESDIWILMHNVLNFMYNISNWYLEIDF